MNLSLICAIFEPANIDLISRMKGGSMLHETHEYQIISRSTPDYSVSKLCPCRLGPELGHTVQSS